MKDKLIRKGKPPKIHCEICKCNNKDILQWHHIVERTDINMDHSYYNLVVLCPSCHAKHHLSDLKIIGVYPSTDPIMGRTVIYELKGENKTGITEPYYVPTPKSMRLYEKDKGTK